MEELPPRVLVVAGHDPTPGTRAGVDADREAVEAHGGEAVSVVTAYTDQAGGRVRSLGAREPQDWLAEARGTLSAGGVRAVKSGLLPGAAHVRAFAELVRDLDVPVVCDPVLSASGGEPFLDEAGIAALLGELLPVGPILTPNAPEAARLTGMAADALCAPTNFEPARLEAAGALLARGARAVLLKAGHGREDPAKDLLLTAGDEPPLWLPHPRRPGPGLHGSGCRHASALATLLARGRPLPEAAEEAGRWLASLLA